MPRIQQLVKLRPEVVEGNLHGIISLYALLERDSAAFECDPQRVIRATYPSNALRRLLQRLQVSLTSSNADRKGNFVISGGYGSGKSHLLLALYHVLAHPDQACAWLAEHQVDFTPPQDALAVLLPMTNLTQPESDAPVEYLWAPIFAALGYGGFHHTGSNFPTVKDLRKAIAGRKVFLIVDEIERWFMPIRDRHQAEANVSFLQNLTEFARDPNNGLFVFLTLLMLEPRIGNVVGRDDAFFEDLTQAPDRRQVVMHRLVEAVDRPAAEQVVDGYLEQYRPVDAGRVDAHLADLLARRELETLQIGVPFQGPLPDDLVVRPRRATVGAQEEMPRGPESLSFGPGPVSQVKTDVVRLVDKTDRLSQVTVAYRCTLHGDDLAAHRELVGLEEGDTADAALTLSWTLREVRLEDRDGLMALLNRLPHPYICEVTVYVQREKQIRNA